MTERLPPLATHIGPPSQMTAVTPNPTSAVSQHTVVIGKVPTADEEDYTIKCICGFSDDDGSTVFCETCETWQHIECYYPFNKDDAYSEDFVHSCVDCKPRLLDRQLAFDRQSQRQRKTSTAEVPDRNKKRPPSKTQKKKAKPSDAGLSGQPGADAGARLSSDHQPSHSHKKSKSLHRPSQSLNTSKEPKRSPSYGHKNVNLHGHPPSPATTPPDIHELAIHNYSSGFLSLYKDDGDIPIVQTNSFVSLDISNALSLWLRDHERLKHDTACEFNDVFQTLPSNLDSIRQMPEVKEKKMQLTPDTTLHWQYLQAPSAVDKDVLLVELNGEVGIQKNYCEDPINRWSDLSSPLPFVFFHPMLPLYIDTRKEGSIARYVRRSCKPNAELNTYLSDGSEYHFWLVSDRKIEPKEQITIPWTFRLPKRESQRWLQLLGLSDDESSHQPEYDVNEMETYHNIAAWVYMILSEHGGCACDLGPGCAFVRFHRMYINRAQPKPNPSKKKSRKPKANGFSPTTAAPMINNRATSEGRLEDAADNDSASSRSKPPSRDMTPVARQGSFDTIGVLTEMTDRDKRKVQMVEDSFRRLEQQQQPPRKKKRTSDGTGGSGAAPKSKPRNVVTPGAGVPNGEPRYVDASTSRRSTSDSPGNPIAHPSATGFKAGSASAMQHPAKPHSARPEYRDASVQTDPVEGEWFSSPSSTSKPKRRVVSLSKRLLDSRHRFRADAEERRRTTTGSPTSVASAVAKMELHSPIENSVSLPSPDVASASNVSQPDPHISPDVQMSDVPSSTTEATSNPDENTPGATASKMKIKSPEFRVQMPPVPAFNSPAPPISSAMTPLSATTATVQSPFAMNGLQSPFGQPVVNGVGAHPSPVKKKLSLSDYKSRMNKAAAAKPGPSSLKPPMSAVEETKTPTNADVTMLDSPSTDKPSES